jgi:hypothetical protein
MKQLTFAAAALLAAIFLSGNVPAMAASLAGGFHSRSHAKVKHGCCHRWGCASCGFYRYTVYPSCGRRDLYNYTTITGCPGYGYTGCGYGYGRCGSGRSWGIYGWLY